MKLIDWVLLALIAAMLILAFRAAHARSRKGGCSCGDCSCGCGRKDCHGKQTNR